MHIITLISNSIFWFAYRERILNYKFRPLDDLGPVGDMVGPILDFVLSEDFQGASVGRD